MATAAPRRKPAWTGPHGCVLDGVMLYIADSNNHRVRKVRIEK